MKRLCCVALTAAMLMIPMPTVSAVGTSASAAILMEAAPELKSNEQLVVESQKYLADKYTADASRWGEIDAERWNAFYRWLNENDLMEAEIPMDAGFTNDYLPD